VSATDFHLQKGSPCIDAGMDLTSWGITTDIAGNPRPSRNGYDIGCYEEPNAARVVNLAAVATSSNAVLGAS